ncbi:hypothetical protein F4820DRAFT_431981 [Hypoxylon rubiginosum]|uniref:Uncharacterized protein n=1 Tax=Hypoxylon rubiginosum TaxID=110542 RepID=A0ACB9YSF6_9PEZI|nr:hypothetical protein F4820DRAFT_431981 [Hypoxylon rubiginosum]
MGKFRYDDPAGLIAGSVVLELLAIFCVGLRFYSRRWKGQHILTSDWLILIAFIIGTGMTVVEIYGVKVEALAYPLGSTIEDPRAVTGRLNKAKHIELSYLLLGIAAVGLIKLSVTFLYWHLFAQVKFRRLLIVWMVVITAWATSFVLSGLLECGSHLTALFGQPQEYLDHCGSAIPSGWAMVGTDIATDLITLLIPIPVVLGLQMSTHRKVLTLLIFMIGALSVAASIVKGYIYITASLGLYTEDAILILTGISVWNLIEVQVGIIAACGPTLRSILSHLFAKDGSFTSKLWSSNLKGSGQSSSFVKMPDSEVRLGTGEGSASKAPSDRSQVSQYELELMNDATKPGNQV